MVRIPRSDELYEREFGAEKACKQRRLYEEARRCTCDSRYPHKWGAHNGHKPPCVRARGEF